MKTFDFNRMALDKFPIEFLAEVGIRCLFTFVLVFLFLKLSGRRGVRQMSLFEVVIILTLGSAAGDVTFYEDVPMLPVVMVFVSIMFLYRLSTFLMSRSEKIQQWMEGKPLIIISDGIFVWETMQQENITHDEFLWSYANKASSILAKCGWLFWRSMALSVSFSLAKIKLSLVCLYSLNAVLSH